VRIRSKWSLRVEFAAANEPGISLHCAQQRSIIPTGLARLLLTLGSGARNARRDNMPGMNRRNRRAPRAVHFFAGLKPCPSTAGSVVLQAHEQRAAVSRVLAPDFQSKQGQSKGPSASPGTSRRYLTDGEDFGKQMTSGQALLPGTAYCAPTGTGRPHCCFAGVHSE